MNQIDHIEDEPFNPYEKIKLNGFYTKSTKKGDPRLTMLLPDDVHADLEKLAAFNCRSVKEEILARVIKTLELNQEFMASERLMRLLLKKDMAYESQKRRQSNKHL